MSTGTLRKYAPDDVTFTVGTQAVYGFVEGTFIEADRDVDTASISVGSDGEATLVISPNKAGKVKCTLQQSSPLNDYFSSLQQALEQKNTSVAIVPIQVEDKNGTTLVSAKQAGTMRPAKVTFADKPEGREWTFISGYLTILPGGEASV